MNYMKGLTVMKVKFCEKEDIGQISHFISELNSDKLNNIGYCGTCTEEIEDSIKAVDDESDISKCFAAAYENSELTGLLGFDPDTENGTAELWGPFISGIRWESTADMLWEKIHETMPHSIHEIHIFCNSENTRCIEFALNHKFAKVSSEYILIFNRSKALSIPGMEVSELAPQNFKCFQALHDNIFPHTYYSGRQITEKIDKLNKIFVIKDKGNIAGYIYAAINPEFHEGSIEFFGVDPQYRCREYGRELLLKALTWAVSYEEIDDITLCVNCSNEKALKLYRNIGFDEKSHMEFYKRIII